MTDTDSLMYEIETKDLYKDIRDDLVQRFDTSNYSDNHPLLQNRRGEIPSNKNVPGMFKDEAGGKIIIEFVGLRSKLYSYKINNGNIKKCKGVKKNL